MTTETANKKKNRRSKKSKVISFDEEVVTKDAAKEILANSTTVPEVEEIQNDVLKKSKKKRKKEKPSDEAMEINDSGTAEDGQANEEGEETPPAPKKKKKRNQLALENSHKDDDNEETSDKPKGSKKTESIREQKRKKYAKLLADKKVQTELSLQQKALNYLSMWKHSRTDWKFEKLRQVWLQQNMFDSDKIPNEFWNTLVEYLSNSKGQARSVILKEALKLVEKEEVTEDEELQIKISRAREIVQSLQE